MDLQQLRSRICHVHRAVLSSEQTGLGLIKDTLVCVIGVRRFPGSKASGTRRDRKKGTIKKTLLPREGEEGTQSGWERQGSQEPRTKPQHIPDLVPCSLWPKAAIQPCVQFFQTLRITA